MLPQFVEPGPPRPDVAGREHYMGSRLGGSCPNAFVIVPIHRAAAAPLSLLSNNVMWGDVGKP